MHSKKNDSFNVVSKYWKRKVLKLNSVNNVKYKQTENVVIINAIDLTYFYKLSNNLTIAQYTIISTILAFLLKKIDDEFNGYVVSYYNDLSSPLILALPIDLDASLKDNLNTIKIEITETLHYADYEYYQIFENDNINFSSLSNYTINFNSNTNLVCNGILFNIAICENHELEFQVFYLPELIKKPIVDLIVNQFCNILRDLEKILPANLGDYSLLSSINKEQVLFDFNSTSFAYPQDKTIADIFEDQVLRSPDNIAVIFENNFLSYKDLNEQSNELAHYLREKYDVKSDDLVGLKLERSELLLVCILGILKSGAAYLPIDVNYPQERVSYIEKDSKSRLILDSSEISLFLETKNSYSKENPLRQSGADNLAYVIYTSGTTGNPKGVMVQNKGCVNMSLSQIRSFGITSKDKIVWFASVAFDASVSEMMMSLGAGAGLCIGSDSVLKNKEYFLEFLKETGSTVVTLPPSYLELFSDQELLSTKLRCIITAGESANPVKASAIASLDIAYFNAYGPTECSVCASIYKVSENDFLKLGVPIGKPISNTQIYILDEFMEPVAIGVPGKLYISGAGVARGYLNREDLTAEKFISNPFISGQRMYDTGDMASWLVDGNIEFLGRKDSQVKIRGFRIELGEIESAILDYPGVKQAVADVRDINGDKMLIAYVVGDDLDKSDLRSFLASRLPDYMVPGFYVEIEGIPLTPNGKVDRKALPDVSTGDLIRKEYVAPGDDIEGKLVLIWEEILGISPIGITDNFFELGAHSLLISQVLNRIYQKLGRTILFSDFFKTPTIYQLSKQLKQREYSSINQTHILQSYPLSPSQERIWVLSQLEEGSRAYNMPGIVYFNGYIDVDHFEESFKILTKRHEILRTVFKVDEYGENRQFILSEETYNFKIEKEDYSFLKNQDSLVEIFLQKKSNIVFDLENGPLLKASLLKLAEKRHVFFLSMHHIIGDGWSLELLFSEILNTYNALRLGQPIILPSLKIQYKDYAVWLKDEKQQIRQKEAEQYWLDQFAGEIPVLNFPSFKQRPLVKTFNGKKINHIFKTEFLDSLKNFSQKHNVTLFMTLMTGVKILLHRYSGQDDIIIGTPIAGREHPDLENQIGLYLNTLAIRTQFKEEMSFLNLLDLEKETLLNAYENQNYPFDELVGKLNLRRDISRSALFDVIVVLQNQRNLQNFQNKQLFELEIENYNLKTETSKVDVSFTFIEDFDLELTIEYNKDIYDDEFMQRMFLHFENILSQSIKYPDIAVDKINYITIEEKNLLRKINSGHVDYPKNKTIINLFEENVKKNPQNLALVCDGIHLTYKDLERRANQVALFFKNQNVVPGSNVIICFDDHLEMAIISIIGILKQGLTYVPIDADYSSDRIDFIIEETNAKFIITNSTDKPKFNSKGIEIVLLDKLKLDNSGDQIIENSFHNIACIIYTSGSTGNPKGVLVSHISIMDYLFGLSAKIKTEDNKSFALMSTICADLGNTVLFSSLIFGRTIHLFSKNTLRNTALIHSYFEKNKIDCIKITPSYWKSLLKNDQLLAVRRMVIFGGEELSSSLVEKINLQNKNLKVINHYGPTETTIGKLLYEVDKEANNSVIPIGKVFSNTSLYILDSNKILCPIGVKGELYIGGDGVSEGYVNNPVLTDEKFIENHLDYDKSKLYKTGDLVKMLPDGNILFSGRKDGQVKIRGYRIELGEIENVILKYSTILKQVVVEAKIINDDKVLVAYLVSSNLDKSALRNFLETKLPDYMIPSFFVEIDAIPLNLNGKVDHKLLPEVTSKDIIRKEYVAPKNIDEEKLVIIWQEVLGVKKIGLTDNFFELGGHSLMVAQIINRIYKDLGKIISFKAFFANPSIERLMKHLINDQYAEISKAPESSSYPATASQSRFWMLSQLEGISLAYNMPAAVFLRGDVKIDKFESTIKYLMGRHEILRTCFKVNEYGEIRQFLIPLEELNFEIDFRDYSFEPDNTELVMCYLEQRNKEEFDLEHAPLLRCSILKLSDNQYVFFLSMHHIISDGWSTQLLISEIVKVYNAITYGKEIDLPVLHIQYKDYALWLLGEWHQKKQNESEQYWLDQFKGELPVLHIPSFKTRPLIKTYNGAIMKYVYSKSFTEKLKSFSKQQDITLFMTLISGVNVLLYKYTGQNDIILGTPIAGREHPDLENQLGLYLNTLAIRSIFKDEDSFLDLTVLEKELLLEAYEHQNYPFDLLVGKLNLKRDTSRSALFDVMVVLQNQAQLNINEGTEFENLEISNLNFDSKTSKFDLGFTFTESESLELTIEYNTDIYDWYLVERIFSHFEILLNGLIENPKAMIKTADYMTAVEKKQILTDFNATEIDYPNNKTIIDLFEDQVIKTPHNTAVIYEDKVLTYYDLNAESNQMAHYLRSFYNLKADDLVGIKLDRSELLIVTILGILKSGAAYVPLDVNYPHDRLAYIEEDSKCKIVIDTAELSLFSELKNNYSSDNIEKINSPSDLAYVIYTSGTTGFPKGVMIEHNSVVSLVKPCSYFPLNEKSILLSTGSISFDATIFEFFGSLLNGSKLILTSYSDLLNLNILEGTVKKHCVNSLWMTSSLFSNVTENNITFYEGISHVIVGGDIVSPVNTRKIFSHYPSIELFNGYGPTENTTFTTTFKVKDETYSRIPIGKPRDNCQVYILDSNLIPVPVGVIGKLYVSGSGLSRGYLNNSELTRDKFVRNPFVEKQKMYDTGDLGFWMPNGTIEFLGRKDNQVKIRGFRIELSEIENTIQQFSTNISQVFVTVKNSNEDKFLIAYIVGLDIDKISLKAFLAKRIPDYMIPRFFVELDSIPLTPNGKIDRNALPDVSEIDIARNEFVEPRTMTEEKLVDIWKEVLGISSISVRDNFFELGGHSLIATRLISIIYKEFQVNILINELFKNVRLEDLAALIDNIKIASIAVKEMDDLSGENIETEFFSL